MCGKDRKLVAILWRTLSICGAKVHFFFILRFFSFYFLHLLVDSTGEKEDIKKRVQNKNIIFVQWNYEGIY